MRVNKKKRNSDDTIDEEMTAYQYKKQVYTICFMLWNSSIYTLHVCAFLMYNDDKQ